jgi:hypothetical protein
VILSSILLGSRMKVGSTTRLKSAPGRSWLMICDSTVQRISTRSLCLRALCPHHFPDLVPRPWYRPQAHPTSTHRWRTYYLYSHSPSVIFSQSPSTLLLLPRNSVSPKRDYILAPEGRRCECKLTILSRFNSPYKSSIILFPTVGELVG